MCVTPLELIDKATEIASRPDVIFCSFGDMLRVPGSRRDLFAVKAAGGDVRIVYSPMDCLKIAEQNPKRTVVFFAVGFETTAPANAMAVWQAKRRGLSNFAVLVSHVLVPPAMTAILSSPRNRVQAFLAAGHVCTVMGYEEYEPLAPRFRVPIVVTGFEPLDLLEGIYQAVCMLEEGRYEVANQYVRAVRREGSPAARKLIDEVFEITDRKWRGIGMIPRQRLPPAAGLCRLRRRAAFRRRRHRGLRIEGVHQRADPARAEEAASMSRLRQDVHAANAAGRDDGFVRGGLCRVLPLRPLSRSRRQRLAAPQRSQSPPCRMPPCVPVSQAGGEVHV